MRTITLLILVITFTHIRAQHFTKGVNVTGWFQAGSAREIHFTMFTKKDFEQIKSLGCDVIRLPINLHYMTNGAPDYVLDPLFLNMLDQVVDWAEELQLHLILDNHTFDPDVATTPDVIHPLKKTWAQMAMHFKNRSNFIYYEILNEPHGISDAVWSQIQQEVIEVIREHDPQHYIIVGGAGWNGYSNLSELPVYDDDKLIYTFHFYDPFIFTHQGATWGSPSMASLANVPFPYSATTMPSTPDNLKGTWVESAINNYPTEGTINRVRQLIDIAVAFKVQRNIPVFCGELGVYIPNSNNADRIRWYEIVTNYLNQKGISWTMWDYKGGFGLFNKNSAEMFDHDLNISLLQKLNFNTPPQQPYTKKPELKSLVLYDDYPGPRVFNASYRSSGTIDFYSPGAASGNYCLCWSNVGQYDAIGFDFRPDVDLSKLKDHDFELTFKIKSVSSSAKFDVRFLDTKTGPSDRPWRMGKTIDNTIVPFNGQWQEVRIPLKNLTEKGAWDNVWYNPQGLFDWTDIDRFEIVPEHQPLNGITFCYDDIKIEGEEIIEEVIIGLERLSLSSLQIFPNPFAERVTIQYQSPSYVNTEITIVNQLGVTIKTITATTDIEGTQYAEWDRKSETGHRVPSGIYFIRIKSGNTTQVVKTIAQ
ncbi:MAG: cellulase family glycosylhydrolase [Cyclobacteriaceae bacterium]|nr:cellulase family glycosylhydrolase [Cyclobacteriaceae bacterium]UYN85566.1 MAG: cellulase family glycosylhydrolase [Cyclobacteriaceae bacterium]